MRTANRVKKKVRLRMHALTAHDGRRVGAVPQERDLRAVNSQNAPHMRVRHTAYRTRIIHIHRIADPLHAGRAASLPRPG